MTTPTPHHARIARIHATPLSIEPIRDAFARLWPEADCFDLLDDSLPRDRTGAGEPTLRSRFVALSRYAQLAGAHGILYTCSAFGPEIEAARAAVPLPTLKPNEAMFAEALRHGSTIGLLATFEPSLAPMTAELLALAASRGLQVQVRPHLAEGAFEALARGDAQSHDASVIAASRQYLATAAPMYGFIGLASSMYFSSQGAAKVVGPVLAQTARLLFIGTGGWWLSTHDATAAQFFVLAAASMVVLGVLSCASVVLTRWGPKHDPLPKVRGSDVGRR